MIEITFEKVAAQVEALSAAVVLYDADGRRAGALSRIVSPKRRDVTETYWTLAALEAAETLRAWTLSKPAVSGSVLSLDLPLQPADEAVVEAMATGMVADRMFAAMPGTPAPYADAARLRADESRHRLLSLLACLE